MGVEEFAVEMKDGFDGVCDEGFDLAFGCGEEILNLTKSLK
jgi:hypothetical protein